MNTQSVTSPPELAKKTIRDNSTVDSKGCWNWNRTLNCNGYGTVQYDGAHQLAHRVSYLVFKGEFSQPFICHACDNRACVNPDHLFPGTAADNNRDMRSKGRDIKPPVARGERHHKAALTASIAERIATLKVSGTSTAEIARQLGLSYWCAREVACGNNWKHVTGKVPGFLAIKQEKV